MSYTCQTNLSFKVRYQKEKQSPYHNQQTRFSRTLAVLPLTENAKMRAHPDIRGLQD